MVQATARARLGVEGGHALRVRHHEAGAGADEDAAADERPVRVLLDLKEREHEGVVQAHDGRRRAVHLDLVRAAGRHQRAALRQLAHNRDGTIGPLGHAAHAAQCRSAAAAVLDQQLVLLHRACLHGLEHQVRGAALGLNG